MLGFGVQGHGARGGGCSHSLGRGASLRSFRNLALTPLLIRIMDRLLRSPQSSKIYRKSSRFSYSRYCTLMEPLKELLYFYITTEP